MVRVNCYNELDACVLPLSTDRFIQAVSQCDWYAMLANQAENIHWALKK